MARFNAPVILIALLISSPLTRAATWTGQGATSDFNANTNWLGNVAPISSSSVSLIFPESAVVRSVLFGTPAIRDASSGTFSNQSFIYQLNLNGSTLNLAAGLSAEVSGNATWSNGALNIAGPTVIGFGPAASATMRFNNVALKLAGPVQIGDNAATYYGADAVLTAAGGSTIIDNSIVAVARNTQPQGTGYVHGSLDLSASPTTLHTQSLLVGVGGNATGSVSLGTADVVIGSAASPGKFDVGDGLDTYYAGIGAFTQSAGTFSADVDVFGIGVSSNPDGGNARGALQLNGLNAVSIRAATIEIGTGPNAYGDVTLNGDLISIGSPAGPAELHIGDGRGTYYVGDGKLNITADAFVANLAAVYVGVSTRLDGGNARGTFALKAKSATVSTKDFSIGVGPNADGRVDLGSADVTVNGNLKVGDSNGTYFAGTGLLNASGGNLAVHGDAISIGTNSRTDSGTSQGTVLLTHMNRVEWDAADIDVGLGPNGIGKVQIDADAIQIGSAARSATLRVGDSNRTYFFGTGEAAFFGDTVDAQLTNLSVGANAYPNSGGASGRFTMRAAQSMNVDIRGDLLIGVGANATGQATFGQGGVHASRLLLGNVTAGTNSALLLDGTTLQIDSLARIGFGSTLDVNVLNHQAGLDLSAAAQLMTLDYTGLMSLDFSEAHFDGAFVWGLRWANVEGFDHVNYLNSLIAAGRIHDGGATVFTDAGYTYIGYVPEPGCLSLLLAPLLLTQRRPRRVAP